MPIARPNRPGIDALAKLVASAEASASRPVPAAAAPPPQTVQLATASGQGTRVELAQSPLPQIIDCAVPPGDSLAISLGVDPPAGGRWPFQFRVEADLGFGFASIGTFDFYGEIVTPFLTSGGGSPAVEGQTYASQAVVGQGESLVAFATCPGARAWRVTVYQPGNTGGTPLPTYRLAFASSPHPLGPPGIVRPRDMADVREECVILDGATAKHTLTAAWSKRVADGLLDFHGYNGSALLAYVQLHNASPVGGPGNGAVPLWEIRAPAGAYVSGDFQARPFRPTRAAYGLAVCFSSTSGTLTQQATSGLVLSCRMEMARY